MSKENNPFEAINKRLTIIEQTLNVVQSAVEKNHHDPDSLVSMGGACELLGVSRQTLWSWEKDGLIEPVFMGSIKRFKRGDLLSIAKPKNTNN